MYSVTYTRDAAKSLRKLPRDTTQRLTHKIPQYAQDPTSLANNVKKLTDHPGFRLRVGDWRVVFLVNEDEAVITVVSIGSRGGIYQ